MTATQDALATLSALARPLACLCVLAVLAGTAWAAGRTLRRRVLGDRAHALGDRIGVDLALGLALLAHAFWLLAALGRFGPGSVGALVAAVHAAASLPGGGWRDLRPRALLEAAGGAGRLAGWLRWLAAAALLALPLFVFALYPPTGFDETLYHLPFARAFAETGQLAILWDLRVPVFPQLAELLFAGAYLGAGDVGPHLVSLLVTLALAALIVAWGRRLFTPTAGWLGAAVFLGNPIVLHLAASGYIDSILALFVVAAFVLVEEGVARAEDGTEGRSPLGPFVLAGLCAGTAAGTKYLGLFFLAALCGMVLWRAPKGRRLSGALALGGVAALAMAPTYLRLWVLTGNPIFPFLPGVFGRTVWDPMPMNQGPPSRPLPQRWFLLPWDAIFNRRLVGWQPPFAPWLLLGLPLLVGSLRRLRALRLLLLVPLLWSGVFLLLPTDVRYLMPAVPAVSLALGVVFTEFLERLAARWRAGRAATGGRPYGGPLRSDLPGRPYGGPLRSDLPGRPYDAIPHAGPQVLPRTVLLACCLLLAPGWAYVAFRIWEQGGVPVGAGERETYLRARLKFYPAISDLNRRLGGRYALYGLEAENLRYFVHGAMLGDWTNRHPYITVISRLGNPEALDRKLAEFGATHLLLSRERLGLQPHPEDGSWERLFAPVYADDQAIVYRRLRAGAEGASSALSPKAEPRSLR